MSTQALHEMREIDPPPQTSAIEVVGLTKTYPGNVTAVDGIDFEVASGEVFGLLGIVLGPIVVALAASLLDFYTPGSRHGNRKGKAHTKSTEAVLE